MDKLQLDATILLNPTIPVYKNSYQKILFMFSNWRTKSFQKFWRNYSVEIKFQVAIENH